MENEKFKIGDVVEITRPYLDKGFFQPIVGFIKDINDDSAICIHRDTHYEGRFVYIETKIDMLRKVEDEKCLAWFCHQLVESILVDA
jgi:hypothetical protein